MIPIAPATVTKLRAHQVRLRDGHRPHEWPGRFDPSGLAFPRAGELKPQSVDKYGIAFHAIRTKAGLPKVRPYELRHTSATLLLAAGVSLRVVADRLGHEDPGITLKFYAGALPAEQEAARTATTHIYG